MARGIYRWLGIFIGIILLVAVFYYKNYKLIIKVDADKVTTHQHEKYVKPLIPAAAYNTWEYIKLHKKAPNGFVGGRVFENREKRLPIEKKGVYLEWDIYPKKPNKNRGPHR
jgi:ribonuclease.